MRKILSLSTLLFAVSAQAASQSEVGALVTAIVTGSGCIEPVGDYFRAILLNSEHDACLRVDRVNVRRPNPPTVKETRSYCDFTRRGEKRSLMEGAAFSEITNVAWNGFTLTFALEYLPAEPAADFWFMNCRLDARDSSNTFSCIDRQ